MVRFPLLSLLLATTLAAPALAQPLPDDAEQPGAVQDEEPQSEYADEEGEAIVVTGRRPPGEVLGDIPAEIQLGPRDIRAYGAGDLGELLEALAPQTASGRGRGGGRPIVLLNGRRVSSFREIRGLPPEAIVRVDVFPEEVALKYGYRADQRVVNFVLRPRFRAVTAEVEHGFPTAGGRSSQEFDVDILRIGDWGRWNLEAEYERAGWLKESERDLPGDFPQFRTLLPQTEQIGLNGTYNRTILGDIDATLNASIEASETESLSGLPFATATDPLGREIDSRNAHLGTTLDGKLADWRWTFTSNYDRSRNRTRADRVVEAGIVERNRARTDSSSFDAELVANGSLFELPAGDVSTAIRAGFNALGLESRSTDQPDPRELSRRRGALQANLDVPIADRRDDVLAPLGRLSANLNAEVEHLSDFGTLRTFGYGLNWSPIDELSLIASVTDEDGAPSMQQLGDPVLTVPNVRVFDFVRGETIEVDRIEGGNPLLLADNRRVLKLGATLRPLEDGNLSIRADYTSSRMRDLIASFPVLTPEIEAAFPDRFTRDADGRLVRIDARPVNFARADSSELRWGFNFSKPIASRPPVRSGRGRRERSAEGGEAAPSEARAERRQGRGGGGFGRFGRDRGQSGRLQLALYHIWHFEDEIVIRDGGPTLDLLDGSAIGSRGGRPRHEIEAQAGLFKNGLGARMSARWESGTMVRGRPDGTGGTSGDLEFSDLATVDLRLFADLGQQPGLVKKLPWLRGTRISLAVDNVFDSRPRVRDALGGTPVGYLPSELDPLGRSIRIELRKLFF